MNKNGNQDKSKNKLKSQSKYSRDLNQLEKYQKKLMNSFDPSIITKQMIESQEAILKAFDPSIITKQMIESQEAVLKAFDPSIITKQMIESQEAILKVFDPSIITKQMIESQEAILKAFDPSIITKQMIESQEAVLKALEPSIITKQMIEIQETFTKSLEPSSIITQMMDNHDIWISSVDSINKYFQNISDPNTYLTNLNNSKEIIQYEIGLVYEGDIHIDESGVLSVGNNIIDKSKLENALIDFLSVVDINESIAKLKKYSVHIRRIVIWIFKSIVFPFLISYYFSMDQSKKLDQLNKSLSQIDLNREIQQLNKVPDSIGKAVVNANLLNVRSEPSRNGTKICLLYRGFLVEILEKKGARTRIKVKVGEGGITGWVHSRYLIIIKPTEN